MASLSNTAKAFLSFMFVLVLVSLALNVFMLWQWLGFQRQMVDMAETSQNTLVGAIDSLDNLQDLKIEMTVPVKKDIPVSMQVPINETMKVKINQSFKVEKTVTIPPIKINGVDVPMNPVPLNMDVPVNFEQNVPINITVPISTTIPIDFEVPVVINLKDTGLSTYIGQLQQMLTSINESISNMPK